jgi:hypothetical protein
MQHTSKSDRYDYRPVAYVTMYCMILPLIELIVTHFVGTGGFLAGYSNSHMNEHIAN